MNVAVVLQGIVGILWLLMAALIVLAVVRASRGRRVSSLVTAILITAISAILLTSVSAGLVFIKPEERGVVISALQPKGYREKALEPGLRWVIPYFESVVVYSIARQTYTMSIAPLEGEVRGDDSVAARTADGQEVFLDASVIFQPDPEQIIQLHINWQRRYADELVRPLARGIIRDVVAKYRVEEVYSTRRSEITQEIAETMRRKLAENGLLLVDFVLRNITFSPEYAKSVEEKQIAEQQAQRARFVVEQKRQEAQQAIETARGQAESARIRAQGEADARLIQARAEAQALRLIAQALQENPDLLTYQYITKLAPNIQVMLVPNNMPYLLPLPSMGSSPVITTTLPTAIVPTPTATP
ncbi:MAG: SPFH domain-containing protein [Anaerolineales bacterium]|nr:SPFH domain-containing protein [Anaerolineales bacterium]MDW8446572.1 SPFH domain-containing protein [Anaerolineales bacterium]